MYVNSPFCRARWPFFCFGAAMRCTLVLRAPMNTNAFDSSLASKNVAANIHLIRNVGIVAHIDAGKTTTTERMLYYAGVLKNVGDVDNGTTTTDFMKEEMDRGITIQSAAVSLKWNDHAINLIDTPGHVDFTVEVERALRVVDGVVALFDASVGVQAQSHTVLKQCRKFSIPVVAFLNKMDKFNADFQKSLVSIQQKLQVGTLVLQLPLRTDDGSFDGVIDLVEMKTMRFSGKHGAAVEVNELSTEPDFIVQAAVAGRHELLGKLSESDDQLATLLIKALDSTEGDETAAEASIPSSEIWAAARRLTLSQSEGVRVIPVLCGASRRDQGVQPLLSSINNLLPSPLDRQFTGFSKTDTPVTLPRADDPQAPMIALAFKVMHTTSPKGNREPLVFLRVYSGKLYPRATVQNNTKGKLETVDKLYVMHANHPIEVPFLSAGQIGAAFLKQTSTGDTLYSTSMHYRRSLPSDSAESKDEADEVFTLEGIVAPPSVISFSLEAATKNEIPRLESALGELSCEDPSLRVGKSDLGSIIVSGMGELHLDIIMSRLENEFQLKSRLLRAIIEYRETILSATRLEAFVVMLNDVPFMECTVAVEPFTEEGVCSPRKGCVFEMDENFVATYIPNKEEGGRRGARKGDARDAREELHNLNESFKKAVMDCSRMGPLAGLPLHGIRVVFSHLRKIGSPSFTSRNLDQVARIAVVELFKNINMSELVILEPMVEVNIELSESGFTGPVVSSLNQRNAISVDVLEDGKSIKAVVPMRNVVRYTMELRKIVKGHASMATNLDHYRVIEDKAVLSKIMRNLGIR